MKTKTPGTWIWRNEGWPNFTFDNSARLSDARAAAKLAQGSVLGSAKAIGLSNLNSAVLDIWTSEARATAKIEGESLELASVRSSVARRLGMKAEQLNSSGRSIVSPRNVEGLIEVMDDAVANWEKELTAERLCGWQAALFPTGFSGMNPIDVGEFRSHHAPMQIVSGGIGREKVHFEAPPSVQVEAEVARFLRWFEDTRPDATQPKQGAIDGLWRAGIAHLWFETIHPFEDGNGRVGRAVMDLALAQDARLGVRIYSMSDRIAAVRSSYYEELEAAQRGALDVTRWLVWFAQQFEQSCKHAEGIIDTSLAKHRFWLEHADDSLSERQRKVVNLLLDAGPNGFDGGMSARKYAAITKVSSATATRELSQLALPRRDEAGSTLRPALLTVVGAARSTRYYPAMAGWVPHGPLASEKDATYRHERQR